jgi:hypothetical protein
VKQVTLKQLKAEVRELRRRLKDAEKYLAQKDEDLLAYSHRLEEARRRTVPLMHGGGELNFLPLAVVSYKVWRDDETAHGSDGSMIQIYGAVRATVECRGDMVSHAGFRP